MSDREDYLASEDVQLSLAGKPAIFNALVACLTPAEACAALDPRFEQPRQLSRALIRHIQHHMREAELPCHTQLLRDLEDAIAHARGPKRASAAHALLRLAETLDEERERDILSQLSSSTNRIMRGQIYRRVKELPDSVCPDYLVAAVCRFADFEAARLLISRGSRDVIIANFDGIDAAVAAAPSLRSQLYIRLEGQPPADLDRLKAANPVSHAYVCARLGIVLPAEHMIDLYKETMPDKLAGLVAWCCGQMGQWEALVQIAELPDPTTDDLFAALRARVDHVSA